MTEVISIKFKSGGKNYYFAPDGKEIRAGDKVIVETAKGLEMAECSRGNRWVEDTAVIQPLRPVIRVATAQDLRTIEQNKEKEKEAFAICQKKILEHKLDMKLVSVEWSFDGNKTLFFFTSDGRVDFRELVKDLASVFHTRIELRQIGVRDEAKMIGGLGICGRPFCCGEFLDDFAPVSTKMAKVQNLSLNPTKISGCCGRLMCCLRYEEDAYEELYKTVPKQGAFVETIDGYGIVNHVGLLRQTVKVHLDGEAEDVFHVYKAREVAAVPGGRPKEGEPYPKVLHYVAEEEEEAPEEEDLWESPQLFAEPVSASPASAPAERRNRTDEHRSSRRRSNRGKAGDSAPRAEKPAKPKAEPDSASASAASAGEEKEKPEARSGSRRRRPNHKPRPEGEHPSQGEPRPAKAQQDGRSSKPKAPAPAKSADHPAAPAGENPAKKKNNRRRYYGHKPRSGGGAGGNGGGSGNS